jgi:hypothetical protein
MAKTEKVKYGSQSSSRALKKHGTSLRGTASPTAIQNFSNVCGLLRHLRFLTTTVFGDGEKSSLEKI